MKTKIIATSVALLMSTTVFAKDCKYVQDIILDDNGHEFEVELAEISGSETLLHLKRGNTKIIMSKEEVLNFKIHDKIKISFKISNAYTFDSSEKLTSSPFGGNNG